MGLDWLGAAGSVLGSIAGGLFGQSSAEDARAEQAQYNLQAMAKQHDYNVSDYKHRYQYAVEDLRSAGLNPILAATNGIGGNINGTGLAQSSAVMAPTPDFAGAFNSAYQTSSQKEIAKMQNDVAKEGLRLQELSINNAKEKQDADIARENMLADVTKWRIEEENKRAWLFNDAQIQNLKETIRIQEEHFIRSDEAAHLSAEASLAHAGAAWYSAQVQEKLAAVAEKTGYSQQELNKAHQIYLDIQSRDATAIAEWHEYLNEHKEIRGAVGLIDSLWDTYSKGAKAHTMSNFVD